MAYEEMEPFAIRRADLLAASICSTIMNALAVQVHSKQRFNLSEFLLEYGKVEKKLTKEGESKPAWQQHKLIAQMYVALSKAEDKRSKRRK